MSLPSLNHISTIQCSQVRKRYRNASIIDVSGLFNQSNLIMERTALIYLTKQIPTGRSRISEVCSVCGTSIFTTPG